MPDSSWSEPTRRHLPIILIRGFGGLTVEDEKALAYQGFNDGSVYPQKRGENYIYEGLILRLLKHRRQYYDATNVVGYFANPVTNAQPVPKDLADLDANFFTGSWSMPAWRRASSSRRGIRSAPCGCSATTT
jgi:hypothetical protein